MKKVVVTGASNGMGYEIVKKFLFNGWEVYGIDLKESDIKSDTYHHHIADVTESDNLPDIENVSVLINNAGIQTPSKDMKGSMQDLSVNFFGLINTTEKYALCNPSIESVLNQADTCGLTGSGFAMYSASKAAVINYTMWTAHELAKQGATCNCLSVGGVNTRVNEAVMTDPDAWSKIMLMTPLQKWAQAEEIAEWAYFLTVVNLSCTGQNIVIDNGEGNRDQFLFPGYRE